MCWAFILVLPLGYYPDSSDSTRFVLGVHGGTGEIVSVIRGCNGEVLHAEQSEFSDMSVDASAAIARQRNSVAIIGMRLGQFSADYGPAIRTGYNGESAYGRGEDTRVKFDFYNPYFALEGTKAGFGIGLVFGDAFTSLEHPEKIDANYHLRLGRFDDTYFQFAYGENQPLISGGGLFDIGLGYKCSKVVRGFSGLSAGMYDRAGFVQQTRIALGSGINWDFTIRLGTAGGFSENAFATGLTIQFGKQATTQKGIRSTGSEWSR